METNVRYKLFFKGMSIDSKNNVYELTRETKVYLFLKQLGTDNFIFRVNKKSLNVKGIKQGDNGYFFSVPKAIKLDKIKTP